MNKEIILFFLIALNCHVYGQKDFSKVLAKTDTLALNKLSQSWRIQAENNLQSAIAKAKLNNWPIQEIDENGRIISLICLDELENPVYYTSTNTDAAISTKTDRLHSGGGVGLNLEGNGFVIGIWDEGAGLDTHEQLNGRVNIIDGSSANNHATHVAGTLIGDGIGVGVNANSAKGMAPQANLDSYEYTFDLSEMTTFSMTGLISNHSYGYSAGWVNNPESTPNWEWHGGSSNLIQSGEDPIFGNYTLDAPNWDILANQNPSYLIVKAAGNDRTNVPLVGSSFLDLDSGNVFTYDPNIHPGPDGVYDCISSLGIAKNVLTVAAVNDVLNYNNSNSVIMTSFSSFGPTDDGRIKPDISANGMNLFSSGSNSNSDYYTNSGTSMATPNVSGSAILLQEHFEDINGGGNFMLASTLKALILHTADETGSGPGPDYEFGWGLMNSEKAVNLITEDGITNEIITENTLFNNNNFDLTLESSGTEPLKVTIVWNDPAGTASNSNVIDDTSLKLVNDLDLRISSSSSSFFPYILDPSNPSNAATTGDNFRDNVERIYVSNPSAGSYTLTVSHKNSLLNGLQDFSLIVTGATFQTDPNLFCQNSGNFSINPTSLSISGVEVGNNGSSTPLDSKLGYFLSNTPFISPSQYLIAEDIIPSLANGSSSTENATITPATIINMPPDGTYYFGMYIDYLFEIVESDETDNNDCYFTNQLVTVGCTNPNAHNYSSGANFNNNNCETCTDGIQNGDETGVDCGGVLCGSCTPVLPNLNYMDVGMLTLALDEIKIEDVIVRNIGNTAAGASSDLGYYLSTNTTISTSDFEIESDFISNLGVGATNTRSETITPSNILNLPSDGTYYVGMLIDKGSVVLESDETDNDHYFANGQVTIGCTDSNAHNYSSSANFDNNNCETCTDGIQNGDETGVDCGGVLCGSCAPVLPNLNYMDVGMLTLSLDEIKIEDVIVRNIGNTAAGASSDLGYYLSTNTAISTSDFEIESDFISNLGVGATNTRSETITPSNILNLPSDGTYYVGMLIDKGSVVFESDETDNDHHFANGQVTIGCTDSNAHNYSSSANFDNNNCETCTDGIQNGDETGVDCGGINCAPCCPLILSVNDDPIVDGTYIADQELNSTGIVDPNSDVIFKAGTNVLLKDGFKASHYFKATIEGCPQ